jgi:DNA-binding GntR family transcriptional regulator
MNLSHGPVRDALKLLQASGLVTISPFRGAYVTELSEQELSEIYQVRAALTGLRARWLAEDEQRAAHVAVIEPSVKRLAELARDPQSQMDYTRVALEVSKLMTARLGNRWLRMLIDSLTLQVGRYTRLALASPQRRRKSARQWRALLRAILTGDAEKAQALATELSLSTRDEALRVLRSGREATALQAGDAPEPQVRTQDKRKETGT